MAPRRFNLLQYQEALTGVIAYLNCVCPQILKGLATDTRFRRQGSDQAFYIDQASLEVNEFQIALVKVRTFEVAVGEASAVEAAVGGFGVPKIPSLET